MQRKHVILNLIVIVLILVVCGIIFYDNFLNVLDNKIALKNYLLGFGFLAPIVLIIFIALQVLFAPIPGQAAGLAAGFVFGPILGTIYSMIGLIIGSYIAFFLSRKYGRPLVEKFVKKETLAKFDHFSSETGLITLFVIYLLPALPDDAICYIAGLTKIKMRNLLIVSAIGRLPGFIVLNLVGSGLASENSRFSLVLFGFFIAISIVLFIYQKQIEKIMIKFTNRFRTKP